ncbi:MAG: hypothetical protein ABIA63_15110 [bacterium]
MVLQELHQKFKKVFRDWIEPVREVEWKEYNEINKLNGFSMSVFAVEHGAQSHPKLQRLRNWQRQKSEYFPISIRRR